MQLGPIHRFTLAQSQSVNAVMPSHTNLAAVFDALGCCERAYEWMLIDPVAEIIAGLPGDPALPPEFLGDGCFSGERLAEIIAGPEMQVTWCRLCGFDPSVASRVRGDSIPGPEPYRSEIGHAESRIEIVAFDNSATIIFTPDDALARLVENTFPDAHHTVSDGSPIVARAPTAPTHQATSPCGCTRPGSRSSFGPR